MVVHNIRIKRYKNETGMKEIFGEIYKPQGKNIKNFLPDFYNLFYWLFFSSEIFIFITAILKIIDIMNTGISFCNSKNMLYIIFIMLFNIISIFFTLKFRRCYFKKYECLLSK